MGAESFHGPVRDGKGWVQLAMGVKLKRVTDRLVTLLPTRVGRSLFCGYAFRCTSLHLWRCELLQQSFLDDCYRFDACEL